MVEGFWDLTQGFGFSALGFCFGLRVSGFRSELGIKGVVVWLRVWDLVFWDLI